MSSVNFVNIQSSAISGCKCDELSNLTKLRLEILGIDSSTVKTESQAQLIIAQLEGALKKNLDNEQGGTRQELISENTQQNIFNEMNMISISNRLILGL